MNTTTTLPAQCASPPWKIIIPAILLIIVAAGCSDKDDKLPVAPNGNTYDPELMALIPAGTFRMGDISGTGYGDEKPVRQVTITQPFLMGRTPVTQAQYEAVMGSVPCRFTGPDLPVDHMNWYEAVEFCNELSRREGLDPCYSGQDTIIFCDFTANGYRLPTEAEWEYACRAGTETDFHTGDMTHSGSSPLDPALDRAGWYSGNSGARLQQVGEKQPNGFGLYDMHGNVYEWCWDWYDETYYASGPAENPRGAAWGSSRVLRGGAWAVHAWGCRSASRSGHNPGFRYVLYGFRVVRTY